MDIALSTPAIPRAATKAPARPKSHVPMVMKLAYRNLFHDRLSFFVTIIGIVFSVVLVAVQTGIYLGSQKNPSAEVQTFPCSPTATQRSPLWNTEVKCPAMSSCAFRFQV